MWKRINDKYECNEEGVIRNSKTKRHIKQWDSKNGYKCVTLMTSKGKVNKYVHRLVALSFLTSNGESQLTVNHKEGNKKNNRLDNLELVTQSENNKHAYALKLKTPMCQKRENNFNSRLKKEDVEYIKNNYKPRDTVFSGKELAKNFGVSKTTISNIVKGKKWCPNDKELITDGEDI